MNIPKLTIEDHKEEASLVVALLVVGMVAAYGWVVRPHLGALQAGENCERSLADYAKTNRTVNTALRLQQRRVEELLQERDALSARVFDPVEAQHLLGQLESVCANHACTLTSLTTSEPGRSPVSTIVPVMTSVSVEGTYAGIVGLIETLKTRPQTVAVESLRMAVLRASSERIRCSMVFTIYVRNAEEPRS